MVEEPTRVLCEGCLTGNPFLCRSFPGQAKDHGRYEMEYRKWRSHRNKTKDGYVDENDLYEMARSSSVYRRVD